MLTQNLKVEGKKFVYTNGDITIKWNCGKTGPGKAKVTGLQPSNVIWAQKVIDAYVKGWPNDRASGVREFCIYANEKGVVQALNFLE